MITRTKRARAASPRRGKESVSVFGFERMSRTEALNRVVFYLRRSPSHTSAVRLIHLFHLQAEELLDAGVPFEIVRMLEKRFTL